MHGESLIYLFFLSLRVIKVVKSPYKKKNHRTKRVFTREQNVCMRQTSFSAIFLLNKITVSIFQIIHIRNKTLNPCVNGSLEGRRKVQTRLQGLFNFWHQTSKTEEAPGMRLHKVWTRRKKEFQWNKFSVNCFTSRFSIVIDKFLRYCTIIIKNFFDILKFFDFLNFYYRLVM